MDGLSTDGETITNSLLRTSSVLSELRSCVKVEVAMLRFPSLISLMVSVDVKQL